MKTLLLGMGNPILSDDAIGIHLAADFKASLIEPGSSRRKEVHPASRRSQSLLTSAATVRGLDIIEECSVGGINLLDLLRGYQRVIVLDSCQTSASRPGAWHRFTAEALRETVHLTNIHDANFATALELGRRLGLPLPEDAEIHIFAVEIQDNHTFSERMTTALEGAYPRLRTAIFREMRELVRDSAAPVATKPTPPNRQRPLRSAVTALTTNQLQQRAVLTLRPSTN